MCLHSVVWSIHRDCISSSAFCLCYTSLVTNYSSSQCIYVCQVFAISNQTPIGWVLLPTKLHDLPLVLLLQNRVVSAVAMVEASQNLVRWFPLRGCLMELEPVKWFVDFKRLLRYATRCNEQFRVEVVFGCIGTCPWSSYNVYPEAIAFTGFGASFDFTDGTTNRPRSGNREKNKWQGQQWHWAAKQQQHILRQTDRQTRDFFSVGNECLMMCGIWYLVWPYNVSIKGVIHSN